MFESLRRLVLQIARVPEAPQPPTGAPESIRIFRAGRNHYRVRLAQWMLAQAATLFGIIVSLVFLYEVKAIWRADEVQAVEPATQGEGAAAEQPTRPPPGVERLLKEWEVPGIVAERTPRWVLPLVVVAEIVGIGIFLAQLPLTLAAVRLDWELRWYIVTDRSLRIRAGIWKLQESTMSFANLQQVELHQNPLQRLLGLADVRVQSAGGGGGQAQHQQGESSLHVGIFAGVENAAEIRDLILARLREFRASGLGDPDDAADVQPGVTPSPPEGGAAQLLAAATALRDEARRLRQVIAG